MKRLLLFLIFILFVQWVFAQDIDIYQKRKNSNYRLPAINPQMSLEEFQLLNRTLRLQDMLYAMVVPGYVHFKAKDPATGWAMTGLRITGFGGLAYIYFKDEYTLKQLINGNIDDQSDPVNFKNQKKIAVFSVGIIFATYFFDWIHGKYRLDKKQEYIRYKYGIKFNLENAPRKGAASPGLYPGVWVEYHF